MKKKILIVFILIAVIVIVASITVIAMNDSDKIYTYTNENGETVAISENERKNILIKTKLLLRKDDKTVVAVVNEKEISAVDLNTVRMSIALSGSDYISTEKELLDVVIRDYVIEDYVSKNGYVYEEEKTESEALSSSEKVDDLQEYITSSGLTKAEYEELKLRNRKKNIIYSQYLKQIMGPLLSGEIKLDNEKAIELQAKYQMQIETGNPEQMDWDVINECSLGLVELFTQHLIDEADMVIYEDRLN